MLGKLCSPASLEAPKGTNNICRHYVAFIRKHIQGEGDTWVLFNDEKVVQAEGDVEEMKKFAYVYFFCRL